MNHEVVLYNLQLYHLLALGIQRVGQQNQHTKEASLLRNDLGKSLAALERRPLNL